MSHAEHAAGVGVIASAFLGHCVQVGFAPRAIPHIFDKPVSPHVINVLVFFGACVHLEHRLFLELFGNVLSIPNPGVIQLALPGALTRRPTKAGRFAELARFRGRLRAENQLNAIRLGILADN